MYDKIIENSKKFSVVSFDLFDTLIFRPYKKPSDVFLEISERINDSNFYAARINAEKQAVKEKGINITIDDIYSYLPNYNKSIEEEIEIKIACENIPLTKALKELKNSGKTIIITTDMYLNRHTIVGILTKLHLLDHIDKIYISSEVKKSKVEGNMYSYILNDLNIDKKDIVHFGDNVKSDCDMPKSMGIQAYPIKKINDVILIEFLKNLPDSLVFNKYCSLCKYNQHINNNYWKVIGYMLGGPIALSFVKYIENVQIDEKLDALWFIARDGYVLQKVYEKIVKNSIPHDYVFGSRGIINNAKSNKTKYEEYVNYLKHLSTHDKTNIGIIDLTTMNFTAQSFMNSIYEDKNLIGIYWLADKNRQDYKYHSMFYRPNKISSINFLIETLITAPHSPVNVIENGLPIYETPNKQEQTRCDIYKSIENGILQFVDDVINIFDQNLVFNSIDLTNILFNWINTMSIKDSYNFKQMTHSNNLENTNNVSLSYHFSNNILPKVSVIVSVYNTEKYLTECIQSLVDQTLENMEIICINDGSTDNSLKILQDFAKKDPRIIIIDQENKGLSTSRNKALKIAKGKYCVFVDSDDYIEKQTLTELYNYACKNNLDMLAFSGYNFDENNAILNNPYWNFTYLPKSWHKSVFTYKEALPFMNKMAVSSCLTMYNSKFIINHGLQFPDGLAYEDNVFWTKAFTSNARFGILNKKFYKRRLHEESITHNWKKNFSDWIKICDMLLEYLKSIKISKPVFEDYKKSRLRSVLDRFNKLTSEEKRAIVDEVNNFIQKYSSMTTNEPISPKRPKIINKKPKYF